MKPLWFGKARIYFNAWEEGPLFWSVDAGNPRTEVKCTGIRFDSVIAKSVVTAAKVQPRAWFEVEDAIVSMLPNGTVEIS
jgi:hypothetical protein